MHTSFKKALVVSLLALSYTLSSVAKAEETYLLDTHHTNVVWHANHLGFSTPSGGFSRVEGELVLDEENPVNSRINVTISTASVHTGIEKFDAHLKSKDFFNVEQFPMATFSSNTVEKTGADTAKVHGTLTLLGVAKPAVLEVKLNKMGIHPMLGKKTAGFSAVTTIKRSDFGMNYGIPNVADDIQVTIEAEANIKDNNYDQPHEHR